MKKHENNSEAATLRQKAEELSVAVSNSLKLTHELENQQIELKKQNEKLLLAKEQADAAAKKYAELYDLAPSGYFTLTPGGEIVGLNLTGAQMLGKDRSCLKSDRFSLFITDDTKPVFALFLENTFKNNGKESCEVNLSTSGNQPVFVHLSGVATENGEQCMVTAVDITERKLAEKRFQDIIDKNPMSVKQGWSYISKDSIGYFAISLISNPNKWHRIKGVSRIFTAIGIHSKIGIPMIRNDNHIIIIRAGCSNNLIYTLIYRLNGSLNCCVYPRMTNHVSIGKIQTDKIGTFCVDLSNDSFFNQWRRHFRLKIVSRHFG